MAAQEPAADGEETPESLVAYWLDNIDTAEKKLKPFWRRGDQIIRRYKNKRNQANTTTVTAEDRRRMNVLWSNVQTLKPALFSRLPKPNVARRNKDKDPVGRWAAIVLERCLVNSLDMQPFDYTMEELVEDRLLPGMANAITEYVAKVENDEVGWQEAKTRYIHWKDQITNPARNWAEVWFWAYKVYLTRKEVKATLLASGTPAEKAGEISANIALDHKEDKDSSEAQSKATVWCIWDKNTKKVLHIATGYTQAPLAVMDPPVKFDGFFPVPRPLTSTTASDSTIPVPDFDQYQDQADEIDMYTQRINVLGRSLKLRGLYPSDMESIKELMNNSSDADMVGIENWAMLAERGGANGLVVWFPIAEVAKTLVECIQGREQAIQVMYQITGISDIQRGATDPNETAEAQSLKAQFGGTRVKDTQRDVQRYIRDTLRLQSEIISEHFTLEVIKKMSGVKLLTQAEKQQVQQVMQMMQQYQQAAAQAQQAGQQPPPPPQLPQPSEEMVEALKEPSWEQIMGLLRDEKLRGFVIDVETDSTIEPDQIAEQRKATEFLTAVAQFIGAMVPVLQAEPKLAPLVGELLQYGVQNFKAGETMETQIDEAIEVLEKAAEAPQQPPPDPAMVKAQADAENNKATAALTQQKQQGEFQLEQQRTNNDLVIEQQKLQHDATQKDLDRQHEAAMHAQKLSHDAQQQDTERQHQGAMAKDKARGDRQMARDKAKSEGAPQGAEDAAGEVMDEAPDGGEKLVEAIGQAAQAMIASAQATIQMGADIKQAILAPSKIVRENGQIVGSVKEQGMLQ